jgi:hypothetical protein
MRRIITAAAALVFLTSATAAGPIFNTAVIVGVRNPVRPHLHLIPEPSTLALITLALLGVLRLRP